MRTTPSTAIQRATTLVVLCGSLCLLIADNCAAQARPEASPVPGGIVRSAAPQPADRHADSITVTVVCETPEGKPIGGAEVTCFEIDAWTMQERVEATQKTDATGTCRFNGVVLPLVDVARVATGNANSLCAVAAKAPGRASVVRTLYRQGSPKFQQIKGSTGSMKFVMEPGERLHGRVTNSKGEPIEGVVFYKERQFLSRPYDGFCSARTDKNGEYKIADLARWTRPPDAGSFAVDSRKGNAVMGHVVPDTFVVHVWHPDYGYKWALGRELPGELNVQFPETGTITGRAIDATTKRPLSGVQIYAEATTHRGGGDFRQWHSSNWAITDNEGKYRLALRAENDYQVLARLDGHHSVSFLKIRALPANTTVTADDLEFVRAGIVRAHLINAETKQRIQFSAKPKKVSVVLRCQPKGSKNDQLFPAEFTEGSSFLMRAAIPDCTYSIAVEGNDPTISLRPGTIVFNVQPGETVEID